MDDLFAHAWHEILARPTGPMAFRFYLQPLVAIVLAVRDGIKAAHQGHRPYLWSLLTEKAHRRERLREGWKSVWKVFVLAFLLDTVYQIVVLKRLTPIEGLLVATFLALVPYVLFRGPANRIARRLRRTGAHPGSSARA